MKAYIHEDPLKETRQKAKDLEKDIKELEEIRKRNHAAFLTASKLLRKKKVTEEEMKAFKQLIERPE